jgi:hypothetical protein
MRNDTVGLAKLAKVYTNLAAKTLDMDFSILPTNENPEFSRCVGYMSMLCEEMETSNSISAIFYFTEAMGYCGQMAIARNLRLDLNQIYSRQQGLARAAAVKRFSAVYEQIADAYVRMCGTCIDHQVRPEELGNFLESLGEVMRYFVTSSSDNDFRTGIRLAEPYMMLVKHIAAEIPAASNAATATRTRYDLQILLIRKVRTIEEAVVGFYRALPIADRMIVLEYVQIITALIAKLMPNLQKQTWHTTADDLEGQIIDLVRSYQWIVHDDIKIENHHIDMAIHAASRVAFYATQQGHTQITVAAIKAVQSLAQSLLKTPTRLMYDAPRAMENVASLTIVALEEGKIEIARTCRTAVQEFNTAYANALFSRGFGALPRGTRAAGPYPGQVIFELKHRLRNYIGPPELGTGMRDTIGPDPSASDLIVRMPGREQADYDTAIKYLKRAA